MDVRADGMCYMLEATIEQSKIALVIGLGIFYDFPSEVGSNQFFK